MVIGITWRDYETCISMKLYKRSGLRQSGSCSMDQLGLLLCDKVSLNSQAPLSERVLNQYFHNINGELARSGKKGPEIMKICSCGRFWTNYTDKWTLKKVSKVIA